MEQIRELLFPKAHIFWNLQQLYKDAGLEQARKQQLVLQGSLEGHNIDFIAAKLDTDSGSVQSAGNTLRDKLRTELNISANSLSGLASELKNYRQSGWDYFLTQANERPDINISNPPTRIRAGDEVVPQNQRVRTLYVDEEINIGFESIFPYLILLVQHDNDIHALMPSLISPPPPDSDLERRRVVNIPYVQKKIWFPKIGLATFLLLESNCPFRTTETWKWNSEADRPYLVKPEYDIGALIDELLEPASNAVNRELRVSRFDREVVSDQR